VALALLPKPHAWSKEIFAQENPKTTGNDSIGFATS